LTVANSGGATSACTATVTTSSPSPGGKCAATLQMDDCGFFIHIPVISYNGANYWLEIRYMNTLDFEVSTAGAVADMSQYASCASSVLNSDLSVHVPALEAFGASYKVDFRYGGGTTLTVTGATKN
jgi:hypothetical protein